MTVVDAPPPAKRPCPDGHDELAPPPAKLAKAGDGGLAPPPASPPTQPSPTAATNPPTPARRPSLAALLIPVPARWDDRALRHWLDSQAIRVRSARKKKGGTLAFLSFGSVGERVRADAAVAAAKPPPGMAGKRAPALKDDSRRSIIPACDVDVRDVVTPLWKVPYAHQLTTKWAKVRDALGRLATAAGGAGGDPAWAAALTPVGILRSPATRGYRNKCEFSVGPGAVREGEPLRPAVGFCLGSFKDGIVEVGPPGPAPNVSPTAAAAADAMAAFLEAGGGGAALPAWDKLAGKGFWRLLTVREARAETPLPSPPPGAGPGALLDEGLADQGAACPPFADLEWERWLVPAAALPPPGEGAGPPHPSSPHPPPPPLPPPEEVMLVIQVDPAAAPPAAARSELAAAGDALEAAVRAVAAQARTSVWVQHHSGVSNAASDDAPLMRLADAVSGVERGPGAPANDDGGGCLTDTLAGLRFRVSPSAFFQVNTPAAALLYRAAVAWADPGDGDVLLDVCCGTGTLGVCAAVVAAASGRGGGGGGPAPPRVLGVDTIASAIADAALNAAANGLDPATCTFVAGKAEDALGGLLDAAVAGGGGGGPAGPALVAIVDPPRAGLHPKVCAALRACHALKRIVYVSCNVESQAADAGRLCGGGSGGGGGGGGDPASQPPPFKPVRSLAVDLFPHTAHVESVLLLER